MTKMGENDDLGAYGACMLDQFYGESNHTYFTGTA